MDERARLDLQGDLGTELSPAKLEQKMILSSNIIKRAQTVENTRPVERRISPGKPAELPVGC